jgi:hypothetical protein
MRSTIIIPTLVAAVLVAAPAAYAQSDQQQPQQKPAAANPKPPEDSFWPSPEEETKIPYRPCDANVTFPNGRHACL